MEKEREKGKNIALIGFMGVGKSAVSRRLKALLSMEEMETDAMVAEAEGMEIGDIFAKYGEEYFRRRERDIIQNVRNLKKSSRIVLLTAEPETILERVKHSQERPLLNGHMNVEYIGELMEKRREKYEAAADLIVSTDKKTVNQVCEELIQRLRETD